MQGGGVNSRRAALASTVAKLHTLLALINRVQSSTYTSFLMFPIKVSLLLLPKGSNLTREQLHTLTFLFSSLQKMSHGSKCNQSGTFLLPYLCTVGLSLVGVSLRQPMNTHCFPCPDCNAAHLLVTSPQVF